MANYDIGIWEVVKGFFKLVFVVPFLIAWEKAEKLWQKIKP